MLRILTLLICCCGVLSAADSIWMNDFEAAKARAAAEDKDLLIDFTGSDWCGWCIKLKEEVFVHDSFKSAIQKDFVLVELDFPRKTELPPAIKAQNEKLSQQYDIKGFPTILLTNHKGEVYGRTGYQAGGPEAYLKHINSFTEAKEKREAMLKEAESLEGMARVEKLGAVLENLLKHGIESGQKEIADQIKTLDPADEKGFIAIYEFPQKMDTVVKQLNESGDLDAALAELTTVAENADHGPSKQQAYLFMADIYKRGKDDTAKQLEYYKKAADADPDSDLSKEINKYLAEQKAGGGQEKAAEKQE